MNMRRRTEAAVQHSSRRFLLRHLQLSRQRMRPRLDFPSGKRSRWPTAVRRSPGLAVIGHAVPRGGDQAGRLRVITGVPAGADVEEDGADRAGRQRPQAVLVLPGDRPQGRPVGGPAGAVARAAGQVREVGEVDLLAAGEPVG
jgi:hypothetical protein